jgi:membrane fusion protein (multidrug efflux system)
LKTPAGEQQTLDLDVANERSLAAQVASARAQLETAEINLGYTEIRAPIDGKISATAATEGNVVGPGSGTLATLVSQDPMYVNFPVATRTAIRLRDKYVPRGGFAAVVIRLRLPSGKIYRQAGHLDYVSPTIDQNTDTITLRGVIPNPVMAKLSDQAPLRELSDQEFVTVLLEGMQPVEVLAVPRAAVLADQQGDYVYVVDAQNKAQRRPIRLGQSTPSTAVVANGLTEGELVISEGLQRVRPGEDVLPGPASPPPSVSRQTAQDAATAAARVETRVVQ